VPEGVGDPPNSTTLTNYTENLLTLATGVLSDYESLETSSITLPKRLAKLGDLPSNLNPQLVNLLTEKNFDSLYSHQAIAIEAALEGHDICVTTGTSSGKSLCYILPTMQWCIEEPIAKALYLYPTKALAQDQLSKITDWLPSKVIQVGVFDGDTSQKERSAVRKFSNIVITNPDMLHVGILPNFENWISLFKSLRCIVLDEIHTYRGVFGSHVAWVIRRLLRHCEAFGSRPQILASSATVQNPAVFFKALTGRDAKIIAEDGSPHGKRHFIFANPLPDDDGNEPSRNYLTGKILADWVDHGIRSLAFCRSRVGVELVGKYARDIFSASSISNGNPIESYRAGYTPDERREIESRFGSGNLLGLAATSAMELGIDIGGLDSVIMNGYPGSISSFWQQAGRAGRGTRDGVIVFVADDDPLDQFLAASPNILLGSGAEAIAINPLNRTIASDQIRCMAHERPIAASELLAIGDEALETAEALDSAGILELRNGRFYYPSYEGPASGINIRSSGGANISLVVGDSVLGSMEEWRAHQYAHRGAVYLHRGIAYRSNDLQLERNVALLEQLAAKTYTHSIVSSFVQPLMTIRDFTLNEGQFELQSQRVTSQVIGYREKSLDNHQVVGTYDLDLPVISFDTIGLRIDIPTIDWGEDRMRLIAAVHGLEHSITAVAPWFAGCDRSDIGSVWFAEAPDSDLPAVFIFDRNPGGVGLAERLFDNINEVVVAAKKLLVSCSCDQGCPRCIFSSRCEAANRVLDKAATIELLRQAF
jgi:DEAD/DEAH box helicase domain-containing protein